MSKLDSILAARKAQVKTAVSTELLGLRKGNDVDSDDDDDSDNESAAATSAARCHPPCTQ